MRPVSLLVLLLSSCFPPKTSCDSGSAGEDPACADEHDTGASDTSVVDDSSGDSGADSGGGDSDSGSEDSDSGSEDSDSGSEDSDSGSEDSDSGGGDTGGTDTDTGGGSSEDYTVCDDGVAPYDDLQEAVDDASDGDVIRICPGSWTRVVVDDVDLTLLGVEGAESTTIDGKSGTAVTVQDATVILSGLTLSGTPGANEGGLFAENADVSVSDCRFADLVGTGDISRTYHLAIYATSSDILVEDSVFEDNTLNALINALTSGSLTLRHAVVRDNTLASGIYASGVDMEIDNNLFVSNSVLAYMLSLGWGSADSWAYNNLIWGNSGTTTSSYLASVGSAGQFENNLIISNTGYGLQAVDGTALYNDVWDNDAGNIYSPSGTVPATNLVVDPKLVDPEGGDFTLDAGFSPCVDAGDAASGYDDPDGTRNDMGAFGGPYGDWTPWP